MNPIQNPTINDLNQLCVQTANYEEVQKDPVLNELFRKTLDQLQLEDKAKALTGNSIQFYFMLPQLVDSNKKIQNFIKPILLGLAPLEQQARVENPQAPQQNNGPTLPASGQGLPVQQPFLQQPNGQNNAALGQGQLVQQPFLQQPNGQNNGVLGQGQPVQQPFLQQLNLGQNNAVLGQGQPVQQQFLQQPNGQNNGILGQGQQVQYNGLIAGQPPLGGPNRHKICLRDLVIKGVAVAVIALSWRR